MISVRDIIEQGPRLHPLPPTAARLAAVIASSRGTVDDVVEVVRYDQAVTIDILGFANSAASASSRRIATIRDAVIRIGGARILERIVGRHVKHDVEVPLPAYGYSENDLWRHSVASAAASESVAACTKQTGGGLAFTASLLHDIGKLVLGRTVCREEMEKIWALVSRKQPALTCEQAEREILGFSHADIGAEIAVQWKLPDGIVRAIGDHHAKGTAPDNVSDSVRVANLIARSIGEGLGYEGMGFAVDEGVVKRIGLSRENFEKACAVTAMKMNDILETYGGL